MFNPVQSSDRHIIILNILKSISIKQRINAYFSPVVFFIYVPRSVVWSLSRQFAFLFHIHENISMTQVHRDFFLLFAHERHNIYFVPFICCLFLCSVFFLDMFIRNKFITYVSLFLCTFSNASFTRYSVFHIKQRILVYHRYIVCTCIPLVVDPD